MIVASLAGACVHQTGGVSSLPKIKKAPILLDSTRGGETGTTWRIENETTFFLADEGGQTVHKERDEVVVDAVPRPDPLIGRRLALLMKQVRLGMGEETDGGSVKAKEDRAAGRQVLLMTTAKGEFKEVIGLEDLFEKRGAAQGMDLLFLPLAPVLPDGEIPPRTPLNDSIHSLHAGGEGEAEADWNLTYTLLGLEKARDTQIARFAVEGLVEYTEEVTEPDRTFRLTVKGRVSGYLRYDLSLSRPLEIDLRLSSSGSATLGDPASKRQKEMPVSTEQHYRVTTLETWPASEAAIPTAEEEARFAVGEGMLLVQAERWDEAVLRLEASLVGPLKPRQEMLARVSLATAFTLSMRPSQAIPHLDRALEIAPGHPLALRLRETAVGMMKAESSPLPSFDTPEGLVRGFIQACFGGDGEALLPFFSKRIPEPLLRERVVDLWNFGTSLPDGADGRVVGTLLDSHLGVTVEEATASTARVMVRGDTALEITFFLVKEDGRWTILSTEGEAGAIIVSTLLEGAERGSPEELRATVELASQNLQSSTGLTPIRGLDALDQEGFPLLVRARFARGMLELSLTSSTSTTPPQALVIMQAQQGDSPLTAYLEALFLMNTGKTAESRERLETALKGGLTLPSIYYILALLAARDNHFQEVVGRLEPLRSQGLDGFEVSLSLGDAYGEMEDHENSVAAYRRALGFRPRDPTASNNLAWRFAKAGKQLDEGLDLVTTALGQDPRNTAYLDTLAEILYMKGARDQALRVIEQALQIDPESQRLKEQKLRFRR